MSNARRPTRKRFAQENPKQARNRRLRDKRRSYGTDGTHLLVVGLRVVLVIVSVIIVVVSVIVIILVIIVMHIVIVVLVVVIFL